MLAAPKGLAAPRPVPEPRTIGRQIADHLRRLATEVDAAHRPGGAAHDGAVLEVLALQPSAGSIPGRLGKLVTNGTRETTLGLGAERPNGNLTATREASSGCLAKSLCNAR